MSTEHDGFLDAVITNPLTMESAKRICREIKARIATLEAERDAANIKADGLLEMSERLEAERDRAVRALTRSGWTLVEGAAEWKPPIGKRPDFEGIDELRDTLARKQRAIDAALEARRSGLTAAAVADILRPEATDAKPLPHGVSPVGKPQPSGDPGQLPTIGQHHPDDPPRSDDRAVQLVKTLAQVVQAMAVKDMLSCHHEKIDAIIAECDGGGR